MLCCPVPQLGPFDGIFFDTYGEYYEASVAPVLYTGSGNNGGQQHAKPAMVSPRTSCKG